ncbi:hypothetical protein PM082_002418 [Marasmius tenuissimus]|nr:hypothetical protein PM082_002418 [Marasmius tenuissimus]
MITEIELQEVIYVPATTRKTAAVIFIHGLGQTNVSWSLLIKEAFATKFPHVEWILPQAETRPVTLNKGQRRPSWFDIARLPPNRTEYDEAGIFQSISRIESLILSQVHSGIDPRRVVLVGFSQGAALSLMTALSSLHELGGVASLSGWIPEMSRQSLTSSSGLPILWCHGAVDDEIPVERGHEAVNFLRTALGITNRVDLKIYPRMKHNICDAELNDLSSWLESILSV